MPNLRASVVAFAAIGLSLPLSACSDADADEVLYRLQAMAQQFQRQRQREFRDDPLNWQYEQDQNFWSRWPQDVPRPREGTPDWVANPTRNDSEMGSNWGDGTTGEEYGEQLEGAGYERTSQTTETDAATGRETTTTTYRNEEGSEVVVYDRSDGLHVVTKPAR